LSKRISIDPITRLEGHGKIQIFLDDDGSVGDAYFQIPELRGFERFCEGRPIEELPRLTQRICGVCPEAHHMASAKAADATFQVDPPPTAKKLRELLYSAFFVADHATHFYILAAPDFVVGPKADPAQRNILGVIGAVGVEMGKQIIKMRADAYEVLAILGGKAVHPACALPGGQSKGLSEEERQRVEAISRQSVEFAKVSLQVFSNVVLGNKDYLDLVTGDVYRHETYYMGLVDDNNNVNFYDGKLRVVDPTGNEFAKFEAAQYLDHVQEHVEPWTYLKFPYLKNVGWQGLVDGVGSGIFRVAPLARLNAADGMATPLAQQEYERMYETLGGKPVHATLAMHWARLIEMLYAAERMVELATDPEITSDNIRTIPTQTPTEGVGVVEAPRGTLFHHYWADENGLANKVNLIVGTCNNYGAICLSVKKAAQSLIRPGQPADEGLLNMVEMAFRAYDPCFGCATHALPGQMPLLIEICEADGKLVQRLSRGVE